MNIKTRILRLIALTFIIQLIFNVNSSTLTISNSSATDFYCSFSFTDGGNETEYNLTYGNVTNGGTLILDSAHIATDEYGTFNFNFGESTLNCGDTLRCRVNITNYPTGSQIFNSDITGNNTCTTTTTTVTTTSTTSTTIIVNQPTGSGGIYYSITNNQLSCNETIKKFNTDGHWEIYAEYNGTKIGTTTINYKTNDQNIVNTVNTDISTLPCGATIICYSDIYAGISSVPMSLSETFTKQCQSTTTTNTGIFGNISIGNNTNMSSPDYGHSEYNVTGNLSSGGISRILGLSTGFFFKCFALLIITIIILSIKPVHIALTAVFFAIIILVDIMGIVEFPVSLTILIMIFTILAIIKRE